MAQGGKNYSRGEKNNRLSMRKVCDEDQEVSEDKIIIQSANFYCRTS